MYGLPGGATSTQAIALVVPDGELLGVAAEVFDIVGPVELLGLMGLVEAAGLLVPLGDACSAEATAGPDGTCSG